MTAKGPTTTKPCLNCKKEMTFPVYITYKKYCSRECGANYKWSNPEYRKHMSKAHKGQMPTNIDQLVAYTRSAEGRVATSRRFKGKPSPMGMLGKKMSAESREKISKALTGRVVGPSKLRGVAHPLFKVKPTYRVMHKWVESRMGKPTKCTHCSKDGLTAHKIHWANLSGQYMRDVNDWMRLCAKCHKNFDLGRIAV